MLYIPQQKDLSSVFGEWLNEFKWDWWATFTFKRDTSPYRAKKSFLRFIRGVNRHAYYFIAIEWHHYRESVHIHALVGNVPEVRRLTEMDRWFATYGISRIWPYNRNLGARYYLSKYLTKELTDWDFNFGKVQIPAFGRLTAIEQENA